MPEDNNLEVVRTTSKVTTRSGEVEGIFVQECTPPMTGDHLFEWLDNFPTPEEFVTERLDYLEAVALDALHDCGYKSWNERALVVDGKRFTNPIPSDFWSNGTTNERKQEILYELGVKGKHCVFGSARSVHPDMSLGKIANLLDKYCGVTRNHIDDGDLWSALKFMSKAEETYRKLTMCRMESDYIRGKRQRGKSEIDWDIVLSDWKIERNNYAANSQCDRAICVKHGITKNNGDPRESTIRTQRRKKGIK